MKSLITVMFIVLSISTSTGQNNDYQHHNTRILGVSPLTNGNVNGLMFDVSPIIADSIAFYPKINGLEIEISPLSLLGLAALIPYTLGNEYDSLLCDPINKMEATQLNGLHIGVLGVDASNTNGLSINALNINSEINGVSIAAINYTAETNGLSIGVIKNTTAECNGVQIGLFNKAEKLTGFQFGLWNKNEKRSLPFINWNF